MKLKERINTDFMEAYKSKNMGKKNFLSVLKGTIQTQEGKQIESTDENVLRVIKSLENGILEMIENKIKLQLEIENEKLELSYLQPYLPTLMGEDEIHSIVKEIISREGINKNQGFLMGLFNKEQKGKAFDNKTVSKIINEELVLV